MIIKSLQSILQFEECLGNKYEMIETKLRDRTENSNVFEVHLKGKEGSKKMAIKVYNKHSSPPNILTHLIKKDFRHVVQILQIGNTTPAFVCMELCRQDLKSAIKNKQQSMTSEYMLNYTKQIVEGLSSLKSLKLMHGDIKPQNIFLDETDMIKIGDLDFILREQEFTKKKLRVGTLQYMAPEVLSDWSCSYSSDIWSIGVLLYEMYFGRSPFPQIQQLDSRKQTSIYNSLLILKQHIDSTRKYVRKNKKQCNDSNGVLLLESILQCLVWNVENRASIEDIAALLSSQKPERKNSWSTDNTTTATHNEDDIFMFPNAALILAFEKLKNILLFLPEQANKFKQIIQVINKITQSNQEKDQKMSIDDLTSLKNLIEPKYRKMERIFERLSKMEGGVSFSNKGKLFSHLQYILEILTEAVNQNDKLWIRQNGPKSAQLLE